MLGQRQPTISTRGRRDGYVVVAEGASQPAASLGETAGSRKHYGSEGQRSGGACYSLPELGEYPDDFRDGFLGGCWLIRRWAGAGRAARWDRHHHRRSVRVGGAAEVGDRRKCWMQRRYDGVYRSHWPCCLGGVGKAWRRLLMVRGQPRRCRDPDGVWQESVAGRQGGRRLTTYRARV